MKKEKIADAVEKTFKIVGLVIMGLYYLTLLGGAFIFDKSGLFYRSLNPFSGAGDPNKPIRVLSLCILILSFSYVIRLILSKTLFLFKHGKAVINLIMSLIKYLAVIVLIFMILGVFNVSTAALLTGAGILSLVVGLGAQPLIEDIIAGLFIVFEKVFDVGDIVVVDDFRGTVKEIGIRTTKIEDVSGNIKVVNNSDLKNIVNMSNELSLAVSDIAIEYEASIPEVEKVIYDNIDKLSESLPLVKGKVTYAGVSELAASGVVLRFFARCKENDIYQVQRDLNRQLKILFDENGINIPFNQVVVHEANK